MVSRTVVSTDDDEIADVARSFGAEVPFKRPAELAGDDVPDFPVLVHAVTHLEEDENWRADLLVHLRPTYPLVTPADIDDAVWTLIDTGADSVRTVCEATYSPYWMYMLDGDQLVPVIETGSTYPRRQELPTAYQTSGVDVTRASVMAELGRVLGSNVQAVVTEPGRVIDIDTTLDFELAGALLRAFGARDDAPGWWK